MKKLTRMDIVFIIYILFFLGVELTLIPDFKNTPGYVAFYSIFCAAAALCGLIIYVNIKKELTKPVFALYVLLLLFAGTITAFAFKDSPIVIAFFLLVVILGILLGFRDYNKMKK